MDGTPSEWLLSIRDGICIIFHSVTVTGRAKNLGYRFLGRRYRIQLPYRYGTVPTTGNHTCRYSKYVINKGCLMKFLHSTKPVQVLISFILASP
jgi:hypothetical protein